MDAIRTHEELTADFEERCNEVNEALEETYTRLEKLEDSNKLLISFAKFGVVFLAARIATAVTRLAWALTKKKSTEDWLVLGMKKWAA